MPFDIRLSSDAKRDIQAFRVVDRRKVLNALDMYLRYEPTKESKSRIKRLRRMETPQYRLRVDEIRVFYDVIEQDVVIIAVIHKAFAAAWLACEGFVAPESALPPEGEDEEDSAS
jgi:mRNA interferase RelE/StbE